MELKALIELLSGKKTYLVAIAIAVLALLQACGVELPDSVMSILAALGLTTLRAGVQKAG